MPNPNPNSLSLMLEALRALVLTITKANGYTYDFLPGHIVSIHEQVRLTSKDPEDYPKVIFTLDSGSNQKGASRNVDKSARFAVTIIIREVFVEESSVPLPNWKPVADEIRNITADLETAVFNNPTLSGTVDDVVPALFETDSDQAYPEAILVYYFDLTKRSQR